MKWISHQTIAVMTSFAIHQPLLGIAAAWAGSVFPDVIDQRTASRALFRQRKFNQTHRKTSHWFGWWLLLWIYSLTGQLGPLPDALLGGFAFGALTHTLLDMCTTKGVPLLPFGNSRFSLKICSTGSWGEYAILFFSVILFWTAERQELLRFDIPLY